MRKVNIPKATAADVAQAICPIVKVVKDKRK